MNLEKPRFRRVSDVNLSQNIIPCTEYTKQKQEGKLVDSDCQKTSH